MTTLILRISGNTQQRGMTLIEILVAIVVLSIGLLGLAGLQLKGLQVNQGSIYRSQAAMLAEDIADRIRADATNAAAYVLPTPTVTGTGATAAAIAEWKQQLKMLPGAGATIAGPIGPANNQMTITVSWLDTRANSGAGSSATTSSFILTTELWD